MPTREASCSCGQLRARVEGEPVRISVCHCLACQQRSGSAFGYQARFRSERVRITGTATKYVRLSDEDGDPRTFSFCPHCGGTVFYVCDSDPDLIAVPVGAFADPAFGAPQVSVWEERKHAWVALPPDIEHLD